MTAAQFSSCALALAVSLLGLAFSSQAAAQNLQYRTPVKGLSVAPANVTPPPPATTYQLSPSTSELLFLATELQSQDLRSLNLSNTGTGDVQIQGVSTSGNAFSAVTNCPSVLTPGASCQAQVTFSPGVVGSNTGALSVDSSATAGQLTVTLSGTGLAPGAVSGLLQASPTSVLFADTLRNASSMATVTLTNAGAQTLTLSTPSSSENYFAVQSSTCGATLEAGASCTLTLSFTPPVSQQMSGTLTVANSSPFGALSLPMQGLGYAISAVVAPATTADYGTVMVGSSASRSFTYTNNGTKALTGVYALAVGTDFNFTANTCGTSASRVTLEVAQSCQVTASYAPTSAGTPSNRVELRANELTSSGVRQWVTATAVDHIALSTTSLNFGSVNTGTSSAVSNVTVTNNSGSNRTLTIGAAPPQFSRTTTCGSSLANGASCTVSVTFSPASAQAYSGAISVATDLGTKSLSVQGTGTAPVVRVNFASLASGARPLNVSDAAYFGPYPYNQGSYSATCANGGWTPQGMLCADNNVPATARTASDATTWYNTGKGMRYMVIDLGQTRTFDTAYFYQANSDGRVTYAEIATHTSPVGHSAAGWVVRGSVSISETDFSPKRVNFGTASARYVRVGVKHDGTVFPNYVELHGFQLFDE